MLRKCIILIDTEHIKPERMGSFRDALNGLPEAYVSDEWCEVEAVAEYYLETTATYVVGVNTDPFQVEDLFVYVNGKDITSLLSTDALDDISHRLICDVLYHEQLEG